MPEFSRPLGDAVKRARWRLNLTQSEVADAIGLDSRTILNIENYKGNPKMEVLYPLVRYLRIDAREIFNSEFERDSSYIKELRLMIESCSEEEAKALMPVLKELIVLIREKEGLAVNRTRPPVRY